MQIDIVMKPVNEIITYWRNPRRNDKTVDALVPVIQKYGFNVPIVVDKNGVVVKGHARLKAAKRLGLTEVPCIVSYASEDVIKADRIADNKIQELSSWDFARLETEIGKLDGKMEFERLFKPESLTEPEAEEGPQAAFKPVGIGDFGFGEEDGTPQPQPESHAFAYGSPDVGVPGAGPAPQPGGAQQATPEKRKLKTLCPYCGKVVIVEL